MTSRTAALLAEVVATTRGLDSAVLDRVATALEGLPASPSLSELDAVALVVVPSDARDAVRRLIAHWRADAAGVPPAALAWALRAGEATDAWHRSRQQLDLIWTGPAPAGSTLRQIDQALLELVRAADRSVVIVTFAAYEVPALRAALLDAAARGVELSFVLETVADSGGWLTHDADVDAELRARATVYRWPREKRQPLKTSQGGSVTGLLHAKCAVADERVLVVSSANLSSKALFANMEMGVLVRGGELPRAVSRHFAALIAEGHLVKEEELS